MKVIRRMFARIRGLRRRATADRDIAEEFATHLDLATDEFVRRGVAVDDARRRALLASGGIEAAKEAYRDQRGVAFAEEFARDVRMALRSLNKSRGFTVAVVCTLALAIGANTVILSAVDAVLLRPVAAEHLDRLVTMGRRDFVFNLYGGLAAAEVFDLEKRHDLFDAVAGYRAVDLNLTGAGDPQHIAAVTTTGGFFDVFGIRPYLGRFYTLEQEKRGETSVVVLSYELWRDITGSDTHAIGRTFQFNDSSYTLIGVTPPGFGYPLGTQLWTPKTLDIYLDRHGSDVLQHDAAVTPTIARLRDGVTMPRLQGELTAALKGWAAQRGGNYEILSRTRPIEARTFVATSAGPLRPILIILIGAVALVLVIACANVGSLQLLRTTGRAREIALRMALGGSVRAIVRQFAVETALLAAAGGVIGVALAELTVVTAGRFAATRVPELLGLRLNPFVLVSAAGATMLAAALFGIVPAVRAASADPRDVLAATAARGQSSSGARSGFLRGAVIVQVALALVLLLSCGVAVRSMMRLVAVDPGFDADDVVTARLVLPPSRYNVADIQSAARLLAFHELLLRRLRALPGIDAASTVDVAPFGYHGLVDATTTRTMVTATMEADAVRNGVSANTWSVDADYFRTMRIPFRAGTGFTGHEQDDQVRAYPKPLQFTVVIDELLAERLFPGHDPIGKIIGPFAPGVRVVGVVGAVKKFDLSLTTSSEAGAIYYATAGTRQALTLVVRTRLPLANAVSLLRNTVHDLDPRLPLFDVEPLQTIVKRSVGSRQIASWLLTGFAVLALLLAVLGIYAVLSYITSQRTKEMGIRLALGAAPGEVLRSVIRGGAVLAGIGLLGGAIAYVLLERELASLIYRVDGRDPIMIVSAVIALGLVAVVATAPAALRAARTNPVEALRAD